MAINYFILLVALVISYFPTNHSRRITSPISPNLRLVPPQPSQYTTSITFNGRRAIYYADTTIYRDRLDDSDQKYVAIIDFQNFRQYVITGETCSWAQIPGKITPLLVFRSYDFKGNVTHNATLCYQWTGCHNYEIPPAPFYYYATVNGSVPVDLILPTIDISIHFSNFTFGPPPSNLFDIPSNCTQTDFNPRLNPVYSQGLLKTTDVGILC